MTHKDLQDVHDQMVANGQDHVILAVHGSDGNGEIESTTALHGSPNMVATLIGFALTKSNEAQEQTLLLVMRDVMRRNPDMVRKMVEFVESI